LRSKDFSVFQYKMLSEMAAAEVIKVTLPKEIIALDKQIKIAEEARNQLIMDNAITSGKSTPKWSGEIEARQHRRLDCLGHA
jgi:hypothetical protein